MDDAASSTVTHRQSPLLSKPKKEKNNDTTTIISRPSAETALTPDYYSESILNLIQEDTTRHSPDGVKSRIQHHHSQPDRSKQRSKNCKKRTIARADAELTSPLVSNFSFNFLIQNVMFVFAHLTYHSRIISKATYRFILNLNFTFIYSVNWQNLKCD